MASGMTTDERLRQIVAACQSSSLVESYAIDAIDEDTLGVRVVLVDGSFINIFYNLATGKAAFAWIKASKRLYGKDNAKRGWHTHPPESPDSHLPCEPVDFQTFLHEIEHIYSQI